MLKNLFFNINVEAPTSCSEKSEISYSLEIPNKCISTVKYDNCDIKYSENFVKNAENSNSVSISSSSLFEKAVNLALPNFNTNSENISSSSRKPTVAINSFNSTSELISSSANSSNEFMPMESLIDKLE